MFQAWSLFEFKSTKIWISSYFRASHSTDLNWDLATVLYLHTFEFKVALSHNGIMTWWDLPFSIAFWSCFLWLYVLDDEVFKAKRNSIQKSKNKGIILMMNIKQNISKRLLDLISHFYLCTILYFKPSSNHFTSQIGVNNVPSNSVQKFRQ